MEKSSDTIPDLKKMCSEKISYWDELHPMSEHDVFMRMIYGIDIEYFY